MLAQDVSGHMIGLNPRIATGGDNKILFEVGPGCFMRCFMRFLDTD